MTLRRRDILYYLVIPALFVAALMQSTLMLRAEIGNVKPDLVLLIVLVGTLIYGAQKGLVWAFVGGLALDLFSGGPMGSSSLALIAAVLVASPGHATLSRYNFVVPLTAAALGTLVYGLTYMGVLGALSVLGEFPFVDNLGLVIAQGSLPFGPTMQYVVAPSVAYNTILMLVLTPFMNMVPEAHDVGV